MSSAFYPLGMNQYNNRLPQGGYKSWKGQGVYQNPIGITSGNQRPQTNKDYRNVAIYKHGLARPIKHYRKGTNVPYSPEIADETDVYYSNTNVASSSSATMIGQLIDRPGSVSVKSNTPTNEGINNNCNKCLGNAIVSNWAPITNLTEKPQPNTQNPYLCCNAQKKARKRVLPASTILKKNYYTTTAQYLYNRCQTFEQRAFNFYSGPIPDKDAPTPGGPLSSSNTYVANCNPNIVVSEAVDIAVINKIAYILNEESIITPTEYALFISLKLTTIPTFIQFLTNDIVNTEQSLALTYKVLDNMYKNGLISGPSNQNGCKMVIYKPNNYQFAQEGAVSSSTRMLNLNVETIDANIANISNKFGPINTTMYKNKASMTCNKEDYRKVGGKSQC